MKILKIPIKRAHLKKEHEDKLKNFLNQSEELPVDENGNNAQWYQDMGMPVPNELRNTLDNEMSLPITDEFFNFYTKLSLIPIKNIDYIMGDVDEGAEIVLKSGEIIKTTENENKIETKLKKLNNNK